MAWELGGGLGHVGRLKPLAKEALRRGHRVTLSLRDLTLTQALLSDLDAPLFQAPVWLHQVHGIPAPQISLAEILQGCGYLSVNTLRGLLKGWLSLFQSLKPDFVLADYAPAALLAARVLGIPHAATGIGFYLPPLNHPLPSLREWEPSQPGRMQASEAQLLNACNGALLEYGAPPLQMACEVLHGSHTFLQTWPELDHYHRDPAAGGLRWWGPNIATNAGGTPEWPPGTGPEVFAYLNANHPDDAQVLVAVARLGCRCICYMPEVASGKSPPVVSPLISYAMAPVNVAATLATCKLWICHAGAGTLAQALLAGVPVFLLPTQSEQLLMARSIAQAGCGIYAGEGQRPLSYEKLLAAMLGDSPYRKAAQAFAAKYAHFSPEKQVASLVDEIERLARGKVPKATEVVP
jgi:hypothetical protein